MMNIKTAEKLDTVINKLDALHMMADAYICGPNDYPEEDAAFAFDTIICEAREALEEVKEDVKTTLKAV